MAKYSNCCGDYGHKIFTSRKDKEGNHSDIVTHRDVSLCPKCGEPCEYVEEETSIMEDMAEIKRLSDLIKQSK